MTQLCKPVKQPGFTLIELLLYISIVGGVLIAASSFFAIASEAGIKNQSIVEVDQQGNAAMEYITQTIRNADAINTPAAAGSGGSLSLAVPTASASPTVFDVSGGGSAILGLNSDGGSTDSGDSNFINATRFTAGASGTITSLNAFVGATLGASPNNRAQMGIYSGTASAPTTLLARSGDVTLTASSWNVFSIPSVSVTSGQVYWLAYNTNGTTAAHNNLRYRTGVAGQTLYIGAAYNTWPTTWSGGTASNLENSMYATIITSSGAPGALQVKEGSGNVVPLTNAKVQVSSVTFKNLSRSNTPGAVQVSFTVSRVNTSGRNEYDYQKTFTATAALRWPN